MEGSSCSCCVQGRHNGDSSLLDIPEVNPPPRQEVPPTFLLLRGKPSTAGLIALLVPPFNCWAPEHASSHVVELLKSLPTVGCILLASGIREPCSRRAELLCLLELRGPGPDPPLISFRLLKFQMSTAASTGASKANLVSKKKTCLYHRTKNARTLYYIYYCTFTRLLELCLVRCVLSILRFFKPHNALYHHYMSVRSSQKTKHEKKQQQRKAG